jgi:hypothetical protein
MKRTYDEVPVTFAELLAEQYEEHGYALRCDGDSKLVWTDFEDEE